MTAKTVRLAATLLLISTLVGCLSMNQRGYQDALRATDANPFPSPVRQQVYLFMMNGTDVLELGGMLSLRDSLACAGFAKVYYAQQEDRAYYTREMARLHRDEPQARMILLGYGTAAERTFGLACEANRSGLPLDAVVFLDPLGLAGDLTETLPLTSLTLRSHNWPGAPGLVTTERVELTGVGHLSLPTAPGARNAVVQLMTASASRVTLEDIRLTLRHLPLRDKPQPTPRGIDPATLASPSWDFLPAMPGPLPMSTPPAK